MKKHANAPEKSRASTKLRRSKPKQPASPRPEEANPSTAGSLAELLAANPPPNMLEDFGSDAAAFVGPLMMQLIEMASVGSEDNIDGFGFAMAALRGAHPRDTLEAMLIVQTIGIHLTTVQAVERIATAQHPAALEVYSRVLNSSARTFTAQLEALGRYRAGAKGDVKVGNVTVNDGGQAILGDVHQHQKDG